MDVNAANKRMEEKEPTSITKQTIKELKEGVKQLIERRPVHEDHLLATLNKSLEIQLAMVENMQTVRDECRENINILKAKMEAVEEKLDDGAEERKSFGEPGKRLQEIEAEIREKVEDMNSKLDELDRHIEENLASQLADFEFFKDEMERKVNEPLYKCRNVRCLAELARNLPIREDGVSVECTRPRCRLLNIVATLKDGEKWMQTRCEKVNYHFQRRPVDEEHGVRATCQICGDENIIYDAHHFIARKIE